VAKVRLKGLSIQGFLRDAVRGARSGGAHLDGSFYYPECGIGMIADALGEVIGPGRIRKCSRVSKVEHDGCRIRSIIVNGRKRVEVDRVVSTIPLTHLVRIMDPAPGEDVMAQARALSYRSLILVALFLRKTSVSPEATVYFPEKEFIFTRAYEPKNRGSYMAPPDETSLVLEIPCDSGDRYWEKADERMVELVLSQIEDTGLIAHKEILGTEIRRIEYAYPVVDLESESRTTALLQFLDGFSNLAVAGRNGRFVYCSIHDLIIESRKIVGAYRACDAEFSGTAGLKAD
jgi:protoporphyrinogen oxidase